MGVETREATEKDMRGWRRERVRKSVQTKEAMLLCETSYWRKLVWTCGENISSLHVWPSHVKVETKSDRERYTDSEVSLSLLLTQTVTDRIHAAHFSRTFSALGSVHQKATTLCMNVTLVHTWGCCWKQPMWVLIVNQNCKVAGRKTKTMS